MYEEESFNYSENEKEQTRIKEKVLVFEVWINASFDRSDWNLLTSILLDYTKPYGSSPEGDDLFVCWFLLEIYSSERFVVKGLLRYFQANPSAYFP